MLVGKGNRAGLRIHLATVLLGRGEEEERRLGREAGEGSGPYPGEWRGSRCGSRKGSICKTLGNLYFDNIQHLLRKAMDSGKLRIEYLHEPPFSDKENLLLM